MSIYVRKIYCILRKHTLCERMTEVSNYVVTFRFTITVEDNVEVVVVGRGSTVGLFEFFVGHGLIGFTKSLWAACLLQIKSKPIQIIISSL